MARKPRSLEDCLMGDQGFARLSSQAARLLKLQRLLESSTPLARYARVVNLKVGRVIIHAANGAVATKLRQIAPTLVGIFRREAPELTGIDIKAQARTTPSRPAPAVRAGIGERQKQGLTSLARGLPAESPLREALDRLVRRSK